MDKTTIFLAVVLMVVASSNMAWAQGWGASVNFYNELGPPNVISVICQSQDKPETGFFGNNNVGPGEKFGWGFTPNPTSTTVYGCTIRWGAKTATLQAWKPSNPYYCNDCEYHVRPDGIYQSMPRLRKQTFLRVGWTG